MLRGDQNKNNQKIIWAADDIALYSFFERKREGEDDGIPPKEYSVYSYFIERYGITLKYPKMPIVFLGNKEWFPIEFLSQCFGKMKAANSDDQKKAVLDYYNQHAGTNYVANISKMVETVSKRVGELGLTIDDVLQQYNLRKSTEPIKLQAKLLPEPTLRFCDHDAFLKNGDWSVMKGGRGVKFNK